MTALAIVACVVAYLVVGVTVAAVAERYDQNEGSYRNGPISVGFIALLWPPYLLMFTFIGAFWLLGRIAQTLATPAHHRRGADK